MREACEIRYKAIGRKCRFELAVTPGARDEQEVKMEEGEVMTACHCVRRFV